MTDYSQTTITGPLTREEAAKYALGHDFEVTEYGEPHFGSTQAAGHSLRAELFAAIVKLLEVANVTNDSKFPEIDLGSEEIKPLLQAARDAEKAFIEAVVADSTHPNHQNPENRVEQIATDQFQSVNDRFEKPREAGFTGEIDSQRIGATHNNPANQTLAVAQ